MVVASGGIYRYKSQRLIAKIPAERMEDGSKADDGPLLAMNRGDDTKVRMDIHHPLSAAAKKCCW